MKPFTCSLFLLSPRYFFFNQTKLSFSTFQTVPDFPLVSDLVLVSGLGALWLLGGVCVGFWVLGLWAGFGWVSWVWLGLLGERGVGVVSLGVSVCGRSRSVGGVFTFLIFGNLLGF